LVILIIGSVVLSPARKPNWLNEWMNEFESLLFHKCYSMGASTLIFELTL
jgi:hypothetical protein